MPADASTTSPPARPRVPVRRRVASALEPVAGPTLAALFGALLLRLVITGEHAIFVKTSLRPWLALTGAFFLGLGLWSLARQIRLAREGIARRAYADPDESGERPGHGHHPAHHLPAAAWLLVVPVLLVALLNPVPLGAFSANRAVPAPAGQVTAEPLPDTGTITMRADVYYIRSLFSDPTPMRGRTFRIVGFVSPNQDGKDWDLARLRLFCCASDASAYRITAVGATPLPEGTWVEVEGTWTPPVHEGSAALQVTSVRPVPEPQDPYL